MLSVIIVYKTYSLCGVDTIITLDFLLDEIVGYTELKNCSDILLGMKANSSRNIMLNEFIESHLKMLQVTKYFTVTFSNSKGFLF